MAASGGYERLDEVTQRTNLDDEDLFDEEFDGYADYYFPSFTEVRDESEYNDDDAEGYIGGYKIVRLPEEITEYEYLTDKTLTPENQYSTLQELVPPDVEAAPGFATWHSSVEDPLPEIPQTVEGDVEQDDTIYESIPFTTPGEIRRNFAYAVETLNISFFEHLLCGTLKAKSAEETNAKAKVRAVLQKLMLLPEKYIENFTKLIAGLYPDLFEKYVGRLPEHHETGICVTELHSKLCDVILADGNKPDVPTDEKINFVAQFVQLLLVKENESGAASTEIPPDDYQAYLNQHAGDSTYHDILPTEDSSLTVLLTGRAGIGKTTLVQWLLNQWAEKKWAKGYTCAFMLNLRFLLVHDYRISLVELLTRCSLYSVGGEHPQLGLWLKNCQENLLLFMDGIDELPELQALLHKTRVIQNLEEQATCLEWCINILRKNILPGATRIVSSRPFIGLEHLHPDRKLEVLGLTEEKVNEFVKRNVPEEKRKNVHAMFSKNQALKSVCGITFYASALCKVLQEETDVDHLNLYTYTQITVYLILKSGMRGRASISDMGPMALAQGLAPLLKAMSALARQGLQIGDEQPKLVFDESALAEAGISGEIQKDVEQTGLLHMKPIQHKYGKQTWAQFLHLSIQELLGMAGVLQNQEKEFDKVVSRMAKTGRFNMAQLFLMGLTLDQNSEWIIAFTFATGCKQTTGEPPRKSRIKDLFKKKLKKPAEKIRQLIENICKNQGGILQAVQGAFEAQSEELAELVAKHVCKNESMDLRNITLTAVDVSGLVFVMKRVSKLKALKLQQVQLDDYSTGLLAEFLASSETIKELHLIGKKNTTDDFLVWMPSLVKPDKSFVIRVPPAVSKKQPAYICKLLSDTSIFGVTKTISLQGSGISDRGVFYLAEILKLKKCQVEVLELQNNRIGDDGAVSLAAAVQQSKTLKSLNLQDNQIGDKGIRYLSAAVQKNTSLIVLGLEENRITNMGLLYLLNTVIKREDDREGVSVQASSTVVVPLNKGLTEVLRDRQKLKEVNALQLTDCGISEIGAYFLGEVLMQKECNIQELILEGNHIGDKGMPSLCKALIGNTTLHTLSLKNNFIGDKGTAHLATVLEKNRTLRTINLAENQIGEKGMWYLSTALQQTKLTDLMLQKNHLGDEGAIHIAAALEQNKSLRFLNLDENQIGDKGTGHLSTALQRNSTLVQLSLENNKITNNRLIHLVRIIYKQDEMAEIRVSSTEVTLNEELSQFLASKKKLKDIRVLNLQNSGVTDRGAHHLGLMLELGRCNIEEMNLQNNPIRDEGAAHLARALGNNHSLTSLSLQNADITDRGAKQLIRALESGNCKIEKLNLADNQISDKGLGMLAFVLPKNPVLAELNVTGNRVTNNGLLNILKFATRKEDLLKIKMSCPDVYVNEDLTQILRNSVGLQDMKVLVLHNAGITDEGAVHIGDILEMDICSISELYLDKNQLTDQGIHQISKALLKNRRLRQLGLEDNLLTNNSLLYLLNAATKQGQVRIRVSSVAETLNKELTQALANPGEQTRIRKLRLTESEITAISAFYIGRILTFKTHMIQELDLNMNMLGDDGLRRLSAGLASNRYLTHLRLNSNKITDGGVQSLTKALLDNQTLQILWLSSNEIGDTGLMHLGRLIRVNFSLSCIWLWSNKITDEGAKQLAVDLRDNRTLSYINLQENEIGEDGRRALLQPSDPRTLSLMDNTPLGMDLATLGWTEKRDIKI